MADSLYNLFSLRKDFTIVVSLDSLEIFCFKCDMEVLDEDVVRSSSRDKPVLAFRKRLIGLLEEHLAKSKSKLESAGSKAISSLEWFSQFKLNRLAGLTLSNTFHAIVYSLYSIEYIRYVVAA